MKLRVKLGRETKKIDFPERQPSSVTLEELISAVTSEFDDLANYDFQLSLNKQDGLSGSAKNLSDFDIVSGDLVHIIGSNLPVREPAPLPSPASRKQPLATYSSETTTYNCSPASCPPDDRSGNSSGYNDAGTQEAMSAPFADAPATSSSSSEMVVDAETQCTKTTSDPSINRYLQEPLTIRESTSSMVPMLLEQLYSCAGCTSISDALWVAVHAVILESGFVPLQVDDMTQMPNNWKRAGFYSCSYSYNVTHQVSNSCTVSGVTLGSSVAVHGIPQTDNGFSTQSLQLSAPHYVRELSDDVPSVYRALDRLSRQVKDAICLPVINEIVTAAGHRERQGLLALPWEVTLRILLFLDAPSLCRLGQTCHEMKTACQDKMVWRQCFIRHFGRPTDASLSRPWLELYKEEAKRRREQETQRSQFLFDPTWPPRVPMPMPFDPNNPFTFPRPHLIGGDYDLLPGGARPGLPSPFGRGGNPPLHPLGQPRAPRALDPFSANPLRPGRGGSMAGSPFHTPYGGPFI